MTTFPGQGLNPQEYRQLITAFRDHRRFAHESLRIVDKSGAAIPMTLQPAQVKLMKAIEKQRNAGVPVRICYLKAGQVMVSSGTAAQNFHFTPFFPGRHCLAVADTEDHTKLVFRYYKDFYQNYVPFTGGIEGAAITLPEIENDRDDTLKWTNGSYIKCVTGANVHAGRSNPWQSLQISEYGFMPHGQIFLDGTLPRVPNHPETMVIIESTAFGEGGPFYDLCQRVQNPQTAGGWQFLFFAWHEHPEYSEEVPEHEKYAFQRDLSRDELDEQKRHNLTLAQLYWRRNRISDMCQGKVETFRQEMPACVTGETRVSTERGLVQIALLGDCQWTESGRIVAAGPQPLAKIYRLTTKCGRVLRGTFDHPVATPDGEFRALSKLQPGEKVQLRAPRFADSLYRLEWPIIPGAAGSVTVDLDWGMFLGFFMGDGSWTADQFDIACDAQDEDVIELVTSIIGHTLGVAHPQHIARVQGRKGVVRLRLGCKRGREVMMQLGAIRRSEAYQYSRNVCVPEAIFQSPKAVVRVFLQGLFESDGCASGQRVTFASSKIEFVRDVQLLLLGFGINSSISANHKRAGDDGHPYQCWTLRLGVEASKLFHEEIGFLSARKSAKKQFLYQGRVTANGKRFGVPPLPNDMTDQVAEVVEEEGPEQVVYDLTVEPEHVFSANGILTHNTPREAFQGSSRTYLDLGSVERCCQITEPTRGEIETFHIGTERKIQFQQDDHGRLRLYRHPRKFGRYVIGADAAQGKDPEAKRGGKSDPDYAALDVTDADSGDQVAVWHARVTEAFLGEVAYNLGRYYNWAFIVPEVVGHGRAFLQALLTAGYPMDRIYRKQRPPGDNRTVTFNELGFETNQVNRPVLLSALNAAFIDGSLTLHDGPMATECRTLIQHPDGTVAAKNQTHDDLVFAKALSVLGLRYIPRTQHSEEAQRTRWKPVTYGRGRDIDDDDD